MADFSTSGTQEIKPSPTHDDVSADVITSDAPQERRVLHKMPQMCKVRDAHIYEPMVVSLGPYHHGLSHLSPTVDALKDETLDVMLNSKDKSLLILDKITKRIDEIRNFYVSLSMQGYYTNEALAKIMFRDGCFVLYYMASCSDDSKYGLIIHRLGGYMTSFMFPDFLKLENQVPLWLIKMLYGLIYKDDEEGGDDDREWEVFICKFLSFMNFGDIYTMKEVPWKGREEEPLHILEAHRTTLLSGKIISPVHHRHRILTFLRQKMHRGSGSSLFEQVNSQFRAVTELKAKGILFRPSSTCLKDIRFESYLFYGILKLPIWFVTNNSNVFFSNLMAFEMSPDTDTDFAVTSYVNFMKSLIEGPKDVKELRDKGILFSILTNDEEVVRMYKEMETYGMDGVIFQDVKRRINEHCHSRSKTWMTELIEKYFHNPWTVIGLFAAIFLLCLTFLQTYYTMNPLKND